MLEALFKLNAELQMIGANPRFDITLEKTSFYDLALELHRLDKYILESGAGANAYNLGWLKIQGPASDFIVRRHINAPGHGLNK